MLLPSCLLLLLLPLLSLLLLLCGPPRLHAAGIQVILDVVYNHTAELDDKHPYTISFRCGLAAAAGVRGEGGVMRWHVPRVFGFLLDGLVSGICLMLRV